MHLEGVEDVFEAVIREEMLEYFGCVDDHLAFEDAQLWNQAVIYDVVLHDLGVKADGHFLVVEDLAGLIGALLGKEALG